MRLVMAHMGQFAHKSNRFLGPAGAVQMISPASTSWSVMS